jgi:uroporphyrinogen decarboxylase
MLHDYFSEATVEEIQKKTKELVAETKKNDGLAPVGRERFWADQEIARKDPFGSSIPQVPLGIGMNWECVFGELGVEEDRWRYLHDTAWRKELNKVYNDKAERIVGKRFLNEADPAPSDEAYPPVKMLHHVFESENVWESGSWWLKQSAHNEDELKALLDRVESRNIREFILPPDWDEHKERLMKKDIKPRLYRHQRGPVTFATSIYGTENLVYLIMLNPELAERFRNAICTTMLEIARVLDEEAGYTPETSPHGFSFADDNCYLLTRDMYEFFGYPILKAMFDRYSPDPTDWRYQHSDSAMGHLLPVLAQLNMSQVNFGPTVTVREIREHMPSTIIQGQLAPFTFSRNEEENSVMEFLRDYEMAREKRGLLFATAGSINNGSKLSGLRLIMAAIQRYGRYC